jgi:hypothetical protein
MSNHETQGNIPHDHFFEAAKKKSPLIKAYFMPHRDIQAWERSLGAQVFSFGALLYSVKGNKETELCMRNIQNDLVIEGLINYDDLDEDGTHQLTVIGLGILQMGYEAPTQSILASLTKPVTTKTGEVADSIHGMNIGPGLEKVIRRTLTNGADHRNLYPEILPLITHPPVDMTLHSWEQKIGEPFQSIYKRNSS